MLPTSRGARVRLNAGPPPPSRHSLLGTAANATHDRFRDRLRPFPYPDALPTVLFPLPAHATPAPSLFRTCFTPGLSSCAFHIPYLPPARRCPLPPSLPSKFVPFNLCDPRTLRRHRPSPNTAIIDTVPHAIACERNTVAHMLLTLKPPLQNGYPSPHAYSPPQPSSATKFTSASISGSLPPLPDHRSRRMSTPHRGLPPPMAMTLPNPDRGPPSINQSMGQLPAPPSQWQGADESMRNWLQAKAEEDRRKQEEERTRQEGLRLEQRKIEQTILRESLQGGVPPHLVPMVFAGMGGGSAANTSLEWTQHYMAQISLHQQQQQQHQVQLQQQQQQHQQVQALPPPQSSPDLQRDSRAAGPQPNPYATQQPQTLSQASTQPAQHLQIQGPSNTTFPPSYQMSPGSSNERSRTQSQILQPVPPTSAPRITPSSTLSRLNTGDMQIHPPPQGGQSSLQLPLHPLQQAQTAQQQEQQSTSPSIYFHHWVPPTSSKDPPTPGGKSLHESPYSQNATAHLRSEYTNSPKKRKTNTSHGKTPETSPNFSQLTSAGRRARAHSNQRSDASSRGALEALGARGNRPEIGHGQNSNSEAESGTQSQRQTSVQSEEPSRNSAGPEKRRMGSGTPKQEAEPSVAS